jgi:chromosome segregation ATPase
MYCRAETEAKQLHQIIGQLRQVRRAGKEEEDDAVSERNELRAKLQALSLDYDELSRRLQENDEAFNRLQELEASLASTTARCVELESLLEFTRRELQTAEKASYDRGIMADNASADALVAKRELQQKTVEVNNLRNALKAFEKESAAALRKSDELWQQRIDNQQREHDCAVASVSREWEAKIKDLQTLMLAQVQRS